MKGYFFSLHGHAPPRENSYLLVRAVFKGYLSTLKGVIASLQRSFYPFTGIRKPFFFFKKEKRRVSSKGKDTTRKTHQRRGTRYGIRDTGCIPSFEFLSLYGPSFEGYGIRGVSLLLREYTGCIPSFQFLSLYGVYPFF